MSKNGHDLESLSASLGEFIEYIHVLGRLYQGTEKGLAYETTECMLRQIRDGYNFPHTDPDVIIARLKGED